MERKETVGHPTPCSTVKLFMQKNTSKNIYLKRKKRSKTPKAKLNIVFVVMPKNICGYSNLYYTTVFFLVLRFSVSLSLSGVKLREFLCV